MALSFPSEPAPVVCVSRIFRRFVFLLSVAILASLGLGFALSGFGWFGVHASGEQDGAYRPMRVYAEVLQKIQNDYVTPPNIGDVTAGALHGLLESLDSDSSYLTPAEYKIYKDHPSGDTAQVGITVSKRYGYATVVNVLPASPAAKAHLADGDVIEAINGHSTHNISPAVLRLMFEGRPGTTVTISVIRPFKPQPDKVTLTRTVLAPPPFSEQEYDNSTILYLKPGVIDAVSVDEVAADIKKAEKRSKIVLDLRDTSGTDMQQGLRLANFFIKQGTMAKLVGQKFPLETFTADPAKFLTDAPLAVLINGGTYGAAELTAAAIEGHQRGQVVGERSFGDASVQKTFTLPDGAAVILTVAKYESPDGNTIQDNAVAPTVAVSAPSAQDEFRAPRNNTDPILDKALDLLRAQNS